MQAQLQVLDGLDATVQFDIEQVKFSDDEEASATATATTIAFVITLTKAEYNAVMPDADAYDDLFQSINVMHQHQLQ